MSNRKKVQNNAAASDEAKTPEAPPKPRNRGYIGDATKYCMQRMIIPEDAEICEEGSESQQQAPAEPLN